LTDRWLNNLNFPSLFFNRFGFREKIFPVSCLTCSSVIFIMMNIRLLLTGLAFYCTLFAGLSGYAQAGKEVFLPSKIWRVPEGNDFNNPESEFSHHRKLESENIAIFWSKEFGDDPMKNPDEKKRFDVREASKELERFYDDYVNVLKIVEKGKSLSDKYKILLFVIGGDEHTAYGGGAEEVGCLWTPAVRMSKAPYGALAHELGHSFQYLAGKDSGRGFRSSIMEMSAQYMLWQVYPEWMTFENYHLVSYLQKTHFAFLHGTNMYHSPYVIEYWSDKHGKDFFGKLLRSPEQGEDPVMTYKRITGISQEKFNDEIFDAACRFMTWDLPRVEQVAAKYANMHQSKLVADTGQWYRITEENCPQDYGYNGIRLVVPKPGARVQVELEGLAGTPGYRAIRTESAGWRYGLVAVKKDGSRVYGDTHRKPGKAVFKVPADTEYLWLVVSGAPLTHVTVARKDEENAQWPYRIKVKGTVPEKEFVKN